MRLLDKQVSWIAIPKLSLKYPLRSLLKQSDVLGIMYLEKYSTRRFLSYERLGLNLIFLRFKWLFPRKCRFYMKIMEEKNPTTN